MCIRDSVSSLLVVHSASRCAVCHGDGPTAANALKYGIISTAAVKAAVAAGDKDCTACHDVFNTVPAHPFMSATTHTVNNGQPTGCYTSECHASTDVSVIHTNGDDPPGCAACHAPGQTPSLACSTCHPDYGAVHGFLHANASGTKSTACTACHGTDLPVAHTAVGCVCHTNPRYRAEMTPLLAAGAAECVDCHKGTHAAHGFEMTASGHNTTTYGTSGARTDFSSLGVTDTVGAAPTAQFPLTVNNTFKAGYSWTTVVTCEDCHAGLTAYEVAGPHGSNVIANAGIDPAYPGSFESASLWGGTYAKKLADGTTYTVGPFAEGIAQWANTSADPEGLAGYQVVTPNMSNATTTTLVVGPASVTAGNVICVKCHDLYDATKTTGFKGWANYAHEHHSADTGSFAMIFGKYTVTVDGTNAGPYTVAAESMVAAKAEVVADHGGSVTASATVLAAGLGREDAGACRNCHIAIPHAWKRPRLIVYSNLGANDPGRAAKNMPATGDVAPYNIGPAVYEGEGLFGTAIGSGQMNALASGPVHFKEATHLLSGQVATIGSDPAQLVIEDFDFPSLFEATAGNGDEYVNWSSAQCNACGHHSSTSFVGGTQPAMTWNSRELNWTSTKPALGAWK